MTTSPDDWMTTLSTSDQTFEPSILPFALLVAFLLLVGREAVMRPKRT
jgi:hypothetical protein